MATIEAIVYVIVFADSLVANALAWWGNKWYMRHFKKFSKMFPAKKGWCAVYLVLVLWIGSLLFRMGAL